jgi:hypothetical protein
MADLDRSVDVGGRPSLELLPRERRFLVASGIPPVVEPVEELGGKLASLGASPSNGGSLESESCFVPSVREYAASLVASAVPFVTSTISLAMPLAVALCFLLLLSVEFGLFAYSCSRVKLSSLRGLSSDEGEARPLSWNLEALLERLL